MEYEVLLLLGAVSLVLLDIAALSLSGPNDKGKKRAGVAAALVAFSLILVAYASVLEAFISNDFQFVSVFSYSSSGSSLLSKVYASWAGAGGSMLFLTVVLGIVYFALRLIAFRKPDKFSKVTCQVFSFILLIFVVVCLVLNPFTRLAVYPDEGGGLNPQLQSFWMAIHPPIVFSAYAFVVLAYALTLASVKTGREPDSSQLFKVSTYSAWLLLTLGIALGGVWAYEVLGWGGYWAWDPVETASLLPWLFLTAYFVMKPLAKGKTSLTKEFMIMLAFASLVFLSALTRGGFTQSVHSYAMSAVGPIMLIFALAMIVYFFVLKRKRRLPLFKLQIDKASLTARSSFVGFWALIIIALVCLLGLAFPNFAYTYWTFPFVVIFIISLIGLSLDDKTHYARVLILVLIALGVGSAISLTGFFDANPLTTLAIPLLILAFSGILYKLLKLIQQKSLQFFGQIFLSLAIIILLIGVFISAGAKTATTVNNVKMNVPTDTLQLKITLSNIAASNGSTRIYNEQAARIIPEFSTVQTDITIQQSDRTYQGTLVANFYPNYGLVLRPLIIGTETGDIYLHLEYSETLYNALVQAYSGNSTVPGGVSVTAQNSPMIYLVWSGVGIMLIGISIQLATDMRQKPIPR